MAILQEFQLQVSNEVATNDCRGVVHVVCAIIDTSYFLPPAEAADGNAAGISIARI